MKKKLFALLIVSFIGLQISAYSKGYDELDFEIPTKSDFSDELLEDVPAYSIESKISFQKHPVTLCLDRPSVEEQTDCCIKECIDLKNSPDYCTEKCTDYVNNHCSNKIPKSKCCEDKCIKEDDSKKGKKRTPTPDEQKCLSECKKEVIDHERERKKYCEDKCDDQCEKACQNSKDEKEKGKCLQKCKAPGGPKAKCEKACITGDDYPPPQPPSCEDAAKKSCLDAKHQDTADWCRGQQHAVNWEDCCSYVAQVCCKTPDYNGCKTYLPKVKEETEEEIK